MSHTRFIDYVILKWSLIHFLGLDTLLDGEETVGLIVHFHIVFQLRG